MYRIILKIWVKYYPTHMYDINIREIRFSPDNLEINAENNNGRLEMSVKGSITLVGDDFTTFFPNANNSDYVFHAGRMKLYENETELMNFDTVQEMDMIEFDVMQKKAVLSVSSNIDIYQTIYESWEKRQNIIETSSRYNLKVNDFRIKNNTTASGTYTFSVVQFDDSVYKIDYTDFVELLKTTHLNYAIYSITFSNPVRTCNGAGTDTVRLDYTVVLWRYKAYGSSIDYPPGDNWIYIGEEVVGSIEYSAFVKPNKYLSDIREVGYLGCGTCGTTPIRTLIAPAVLSYELEERPGTGDYTFTSAYYIEDVIMTLFNKIISVSIDANSFSSLDIYEDKTYLGSLTPYKTLFLLGLSDAILTENSQVKSNRQTILNVSLKEILDFFEQRGFFWYLEDIGGVYYFRLKLNIHKVLIPSSLDVTENLGHLNRLKKIEIKYKKIVIFENGNDTKNYPFGLKQYEMSYSGNTEVISEPILVNINDIIDARAEKYSETDLEKAVIVAASLIPSTLIYEVREVSDLDIVPALNNYELSFYYIIKNIKTDFFLELDYSMPKIKYEKPKYLTLQLYNNDITGFKAFESMQFEGVEYEIAEITKKLKENYLTLKMKTW